MQSTHPTPAPATSRRRVSPWSAYVPAYADCAERDDQLPGRAEPWLKNAGELSISPGFYLDEASNEAVAAYARSRPWVWPQRRHYLLTDVHADADAFLRCLKATGGVERTGPGEQDFALTSQGSAAVFVIAGDCFDKGPSNLRLLRALKHLIDLDAEVVLLAGNHDVRALVGMSCLGETEPRLAHLFARMGKKAVPLFNELVDGYLERKLEPDAPSELARLRQRLFPPQSWAQRFPEAVRGVIPDRKIGQELIRIQEKCRDLEEHCARSGLPLSDVERAADKFRELFLTPGGEFAWFFDRMQLAYRSGSFLFVHAGVDDALAARVRSEGVEGINRWFRQLLEDRELFDLYHGPVGNAFRTKYRDTDLPLSRQGACDLQRCGIYAIAHGHRNIVHGQRMVFRRGFLNFECDASVDRNTRVLEGLPGPGGAATIFREDGCVLGVSTDFPAVKVFDAARTARAFTFMQPLNDPQGRSADMANIAEENEETSGLTAVPDEPEVEAASEKNNTKLSFERRMEVEEAVAYFEAIVAGLKKGSIQFRRGEQQLDLSPSSQVRVKVKATSKGSKEKLEFELGWETAPDDASDLEIG